MLNQTNSRGTQRAKKEKKILVKQLNFKWQVSGVVDGLNRVTSNIKDDTKQTSSKNAKISAFNHKQRRKKNIPKKATLYK